MRLGKFEHSPDVRALFYLLAVSLLISCGGGGGTQTPTPPTPPTPPTTPPVTPPPADTCSVTVADGPFELIWPGESWETNTPESQGLCPDELNEAADYAFGDGNATGAVLIIKNGYLVFERFAEDRDHTDLVTSWSVGKSMTSMLMGIALEQEHLAGLDQSASTYIPSWEEGDKSAITVDYMMTLRTALAVVDAGAFYEAANQLEMAVDRDLIGTPGSRLYGYSNADVMVAGEVILQATGMNAQEYLNLHVGARIGFNGEWWVDSEGNVLTYCCIDAPPRDFGRFGLLYARSGKWQDDQIVPEAWVGLSTLPARTGTYAYYWWPLTHNGFGAFGLQGQIVAIYPDVDLIVMRFTRYIRQGDGSVVRSGGNYHDTPAPQNFNNATFLNLVRESVPQ